MDNCWSENKNQFMFGFLGWLLILGWYEEIRVTFLCVGHTANENDSIIFAPIHKNLSAITMHTLYGIMHRMAIKLPKPHR